MIKADYNWILFYEYYIWKRVILELKQETYFSNNLAIKNYQTIIFKTIKPSVGIGSKCDNTPLVRV